MAELTNGEVSLDPLIVFPPDGRATYKSSSYPWRCVCRVGSGGDLGSGVLIGPRHVLTASHVVDWTTNKVRVALNRFDGTTSGIAYAQWIYRYEEISDTDTGNVQEDWVVLVLTKRLGDSAGWLGAREYWDDWDGEPYWHSMGYASDMGGTDRPLRQSKIKLKQWDSGGSFAMTTTTGDFMHIQSGSPVFGFWDTLDVEQAKVVPMPYAVGVVSAQGEGCNWVGGGDDMVDLIIEAREGRP